MAKESDSKYESSIARKILQINPDTGEPFGSKIAYDEYIIRQRRNPETGRRYKSVREYREYLGVTGTDYQNKLARAKKSKRTGKHYRNAHEYQLERIKSRINPLTGKKFKTEREYRQYLIARKAEERESQEIGRESQGEGGLERASK